MDRKKHNQDKLRGHYKVKRAPQLDDVGQLAALTNEKMAYYIFQKNNLWKNVDHMKLGKDQIFVDGNTRRLEKTFKNIKFDIRDGKRYIRNPNDNDPFVNVKPMSEIKKRKGQRMFQSSLRKTVMTDKKSE